MIAHPTYDFKAWSLQFPQTTQILLILPTLCAQTLINNVNTKEELLLVFLSPGFEFTNLIFL